MRRTTFVKCHTTLRASLLVILLLLLLYAHFYCIISIEHTVATSFRQSLYFRNVDFIYAFTQKSTHTIIWSYVTINYLVSLLMLKFVYYYV